MAKNNLNQAKSSCCEEETPRTLPDCPIHAFHSLEGYVSCFHQHYSLGSINAQ